MKKTLVKLCLALVALAASPLLARADMIFYDGFNYPNGFVEYSSGFLWVTNSFGGAGSANDMYVVNHKLEVSATGGIVSRANDCNRQFSVTNNSYFTNATQVLYASFTVICTNLPNGAGTYFAAFYAAPLTGGGYYGRIFAATNGTSVPNTWRLGVSATTSSYNHQYPADLATNVPYQVVAQLDPVTLDAITLWVNPVDSTDPSQTSSDVPSGVTAPIDSFAFRQASSFGNAFFQITNLATATTFAEAATNVWPTNALAPIIAYQPVSVTNFPGSSFNLSVAADGQGLGNLAYQWQENGANIANPNGNTNVLAFVSVPANSGTNTYDVVVTTPYGLSVTSSVVTVAISTTPQPPIFVSQPANLALYQSQNAIFTTTVATPGNATFTWYSNNVIMTAGVSSSAFSSSLELDNITTANQATFRVAVTNDVFATGIVSTNASLVVKVPAAVTIGFLHTLVDPNTFLATNTPPTIAYQATGIVTTYTNITTGNTASYYLQDGTGGINIFVTGGSTFRPQQGDVVTFVGVMSSFTSGLELYADVADSSFPFTSFTVLSNNIAGLPWPRTIAYNFLSNKAYANTNIAGSLVQIFDVYFGTNAGTVTSVSGNTTVAVTNSAGQPFFLLFPDLDLDVAGQTLPAYAYSVSGVLYSGNDIATNILLVTRFADVITTPPTPLPLNFAKSGKNVTLSWTNDTFALQTSTNVTGPYTTLTNTLNGAFTTSVTNNPKAFFRLMHP